VKYMTFCRGEVNKIKNSHAKTINTVRGTLSMTDNNIPSKNTFSRFFRALLSRLKAGFNWFANLIQKLKNTPKSSNSSSPESSISPVYRGDIVDILPTRGMNTPDNTAGTSEELISPQTVQNSGKASEDLMDASNDIPNRMN